MGNWVVPPPPGQACCLQKPPAFLSHWGNLSQIQSLQLFRQGALPVSASPLTNAAGGDYLTAHHRPSLPPSHTPGPPPVHTCPQPTQLQTPNPPQHTALCCQAHWDLSTPGSGDCPQVHALTPDVRRQEGLEGTFPRG